jgi:hypothetical protein
MAKQSKQIGSISGILDFIEKEGLAGLDEIPYAYASGFRDGVKWACEKARERLARFQP